MGLLTGFSVLSGVEIVYFLLRFLAFYQQHPNPQIIGFYQQVCRCFLSLKTQRSDVVASVGKRFENHLTRKD